MGVLVILISIVIFIVSPKPAFANKKICAAIVGGFSQPFKEIACVYEEKTGVKIDVTFSSAGRLYGQIIYEAPFDIFLSADRDRPDPPLFKRNSRKTVQLI